MRKVLIGLILSPLSISAMERLSGFCEQGAKVVVAPQTPGGPPITRSFQQSYPRCTVTVFVTGTATMATIYSTNEPNPTVLSNPFQADQFGYWDFYAMNGHFDVRISGSGLATPYTFGDLSLFDIIDYSPCPNCILSATGFISTGGQYNDFSSQTGGMLIRGINITQNATGLAGGYIKLSPITYNPNDGPPIFDQYGNPIRDPVYLPGDTLGTHDAVLFVGEATDLIPNPDLVMGLFTNVYIFSRVGFATDYASEASFQSLNGGMQALSFAAVNYVNSGQHSGSPPPLTNLDQFHPGAIFFDTAAGCEKVYDGTLWKCLGTGGGSGSPAGSNTQVQFNNSGAFGASANFTFDPGAKLLNVVANNSSSAGINVQVGFIQSDIGFVASNLTALTYNAVQAVGGGMAAKSFTAINYMQTGNSSGIPTPTSGDSFHAGAQYWDTVAGCQEVYTGSGWVCLGSGGATSPGGSSTMVQYNSGGSFAGSADFEWLQAQKLLNVVATAGQAGINVQLGYIQSALGFVAVPASATTYNAVSALGGGMAANSFTAAKYVQVGNSPAIPALSGGDSFHAGALYWSTASNAMQVYNGSAWVSLGGGSGTPGGVDTNIQFNSGGSFGGTNNFTWDNGNHILNVSALSSSTAGINVQIGFVQSAVGFVAVPGSATTYNAIQAAGGGMTAKSFTAALYIQTGQSFGTPLVTSGDSFHAGSMYWDSGTNCEQLYNGSSWSCIGSGGGGTPGGSNTAVQFNNSGTFGGSTNFTWNNSTNLLNVVALNSSSAGINVQTGFVQSDGGFNAPIATTYNAVQAINGGGAFGSVTAVRYVQVGSYSGAAPTLTGGDSFHAGALSWNNAASQMYVYNGASWVSLTTIAGVSSVSGTTSQVLVNGGTAPQSGAITLTLPQNIATSSTPTFTGVVSNGAFNSTSTGSSISFQTSNTLFQVDGNGNVSTSNQFNITGGSGAPGYKVNGTVVIAGTRNATFANIEAGNGAASSEGQITAKPNITTAIAFTTRSVLGGPFKVLENGDTTVATLSSTGVVQSSATGSSIAFQTASPFNFQVNGNGAISGQTLNIAGLVRIDSSGYFYGGTEIGVDSTTCSKFRRGICVTP